MTASSGRIEQHPLGRFIYVHPISSVEQALASIDRNVQTVSVAPWERVWEVADRLTLAGADRIVQVGRTGRMRPGFIHDGFHPMQRMVRWATIERSLDYKFRFMKTSAREDEDNVYRKGSRIPH